MSLGSGYPLHLQCARCRAGLVRLEATGATRNLRAVDGVYEDGHEALKRVTNERRQYKCNACGHVGWSRHRDMLQLERIRVGAEPPLVGKSFAETARLARVALDEIVGTLEKVMDDLRIVLQLNQANEETIAELRADNARMRRQLEEVQRGSS